MRLALLLPIAGLIVAVGLLQWGDRIQPPVGTDTIFVSAPTLICLGINAPALIFKGLMILTPLKVDQDPPQPVLGFGRSELYFLLGVAVLWYLVGYFLDGWSQSSIQRRGAAPGTLSKVLTTVCLFLVMIWAGALFLEALNPHDGYMWRNTAGNIEGIPFFSWSVVLIGISVLKLWRVWVAGAYKSQPS